MKKIFILTAFVAISALCAHANNNSPIDNSSTEVVAVSDVTDNPSVQPIAEDSAPLDVSVCDERLGLWYVQPKFGYTVSPIHGAIAGVSVGYVWNCGVGMELYGNFRMLHTSPYYHTGLDIAYEFSFLNKVRPFIGVGPGLIVGSDRYVLPSADIHTGCSFVLKPKVVELNLEYRCDFLIFPQEYVHGALRVHSLDVSCRVYL